MNDESKLTDALDNPDAKLRDVDETLGSRYLSHFVAVKKEKREVSPRPAVYTLSSTMPIQWRYSFIVSCNMMSVLRRISVC